MTRKREVLAPSASLAVSAEDVPESAYDESEALPYESTLLCSQSWCRWWLCEQLRRSQAPCTLDLVLHPPFRSARVRDADANRAADTQRTWSFVSDTNK